MPQRRKTVQAVEADVFIAIAHPVRRQILEQLIDGEVTANQLAEPFKISRSAVSQHLTVLLDAGLVTRERQGREQRYHLHVENLNELQSWLTKFDKLWKTKLNALESVLDEIEAEEDEA